MKQYKKNTGQIHYQHKRTREEERKEEMRGEEGYLFPS